MTTNRKVLLINGPNLNMLGVREPGHYGQTSLDHIVADLTTLAASFNIQLEHVQSNAEHVLIDTLHQAMGKVDFIIINPAAFTHTSVALRDAILAVGIPFIEVHLSNVHAREPFRHHSYFSDKAEGVIVGLGADGYEFALRAVAKRLQAENN
ncbi:3-dehydroquinate dehydratase [Grimontia celer]|uniref:3-dehydroquinate dehydratase n=1 Tax=Grimontia celer TaxID=1796497 RepID=A0A128FFH5_9GAMM|nr:type II 3-dehydroquinate dehydratase [Grimontia celer]CZF85280.1 3-dehydroquinate dehydratase [Grimontia celer]